MHKLVRRQARGTLLHTSQAQNNQTAGCRHGAGRLTLPYQSMRGTLVAPTTVTSSSPCGFSKACPTTPVTRS